MLFGVWFTRIGADQVKPPSVDIEKAMLVYWPLPKRVSCQTAYRLPLAGSRATRKPQGTTRVPTPPSGLGTLIKGNESSSGRMSATGMGASVNCQVCPWSDERIKDSLTSQ